MKARNSLSDSLLDRAIDLAERGRYTVPPNPMVGAIVARGNRVIAESWHARAGAAHAEVLALARAGTRSRGADLYLTLEPCVHFGRTPPCAAAVIESGVSRVFVAARDPNPLVSGRGIRALRAAGVEVFEAGGSLRRRAERQNDKFRFWITEARPFVLAKWAATLDGKVADASRRGRWITRGPARRRALLLREEYDAILVGSGTVLADDPLLTRRLGRAGGRRHRRVVLDGRLRVPDSARLFRRPEDVILVTSLSQHHARARRLARRGVRIWSVPGRDGRVDIRRMLGRLAEEGVTSLLVEGGGEAHWGFFRAGLVNRVAVFTAPRILGGAAAPVAVAGDGFPIGRAVEIVDIEHERLGADWLVTGRVARG